MYLWGLFQRHGLSIHTISRWKTLWSWCVHGVWVIYDQQKGVALIELAVGERGLY
jgi:hypothetical protein